ncbi:MAG: Bug family tripartite tricarboxylate transporter substrate binding protein [Beijerinckiaceae bacterium]
MRRALTAILCASAYCAPAIADPVADFYQNRTINLYIGYGPGGAYDTYSRMIARYMPAHLPGNPRINPSNMPGASSMLMANHLARVAPKDGTAMGAVNSALVFDPLFAGANSKAQFAGPDLTMIGNIVSSASVLVAWATSGVKTIDDVREKGLLIGATSPSGDTYLLPLSVKNILGLDKLKIVTGYPGTREAALALEQGEISGRVWDMEGIKASRPDWLRDGKINIIAQLAPRKMPEVPSQVPLIKDYVKDPNDRTALDVIFLSTILARPYIGPPGVPADRVRALRAAFIKTVQDPEFVAEAKKRQLTIDPTSGEEMEKIIADAYKLPPATVEKVRRALTVQ